MALLMMLEDQLVYPKAKEYFCKGEEPWKLYTCFKALPLIVVPIKQLQALGFYENNLEHL